MLRSRISRLGVASRPPPRVLAALAPAALATPRQAPWADHQQRCCFATQSTPPPQQPEKAPTRWERMKTLFREHGPVFVVYYGSTWTAGLAVAYGSITVAGLDGLEVRASPCGMPIARC